MLGVLRDAAIYFAVWLVLVVNVRGAFAVSTERSIAVAALCFTLALILKLLNKNEESNASHPS